MKKPPAGHYRKILPEELKHLRFALAHTPIIGAEKFPDMSEDLANFMDNSEDEYAEYYAEGLRDGSIIPIVPNAQISTPGHWAPGELFFKS